jgi:Ser/Thr protein kinase RdoA (MazF antagonist)
MDQSQAQELCSALGLGTPIGNVQAVSGGLLHHMWRLNTTSGTYAVKELDPTFIAHPGAVAFFENTERIASLMARAGIPAVAAINAASGPVLALGEAAFLVYEWIDGKTLPPGPAGPTAAREIGAVLGHIHLVDTTGTEWPPLESAVDTFRDDEWVLLARRGAAENLPWAAALRDLQPNLVVWNARYRRVVGDLLKTQVISHRDLDQRNVLWQSDQSLLIVDWESAGAVNPAVELADVALNWSGLTVGEPDPNVFHAVLAGYRSTGATIRDEPRDVFYATLAHWLSWLKFNIQRSLGEAAATPAERDLGTHETTDTLAIVQRLASGIDLYASWLDGL